MDGDSKQVATLAGGCFWCLEAVYEQVRGIERVESGYSGGHVQQPSYDQVSTESTGHAEVVHITFEPGDISYRELLEVFFAIHDPTTLNLQGPDTGPQYRSAIFFHDSQQKADAEDLIEELDAAGTWDRPIVTEVAPFTAFYPAEEYHQQYYVRNSGQAYCQLIISPKVAKFRDQFAGKLKPGATGAAARG